MHNCTWACGNTVSIASGNPFSPSTQAMNTSFTPRLFSSVNTCSQNLAPSCAEVHSPSTSLRPSRSIPNRHVHRPVLHLALMPHLHHQRVQEQHGIQWLQRPHL